MNIVKGYSIGDFELNDLAVINVNVVMSSYNNDKYIEKQIKSILDQQGVNVKLYIRDDGSTDNTVNIINKLIKQYDKRIYLSCGENLGIHKSFDKALKDVESTDYIAFSDADDYWHSDKLFIAVMSMIKEKASFYSSSARLVDENLDYLHKDTTKRRKYNHYMNSINKILTQGAQGCTIVIDKDLFEMIRGYNHGATLPHDLWISTVAYYTKKSIYDLTPHMDYRQHNLSWTGNRNNKYRQFFREFKHFMDGLKRYPVLADLLIGGYGHILSKKDLEILELLKSVRKSYTSRFKLVLNIKFRKYGFFQNVFFKFFLLFGLNR